MLKSGAPHNQASTPDCRHLERNPLETSWCRGKKEKSKHCRVCGLLPRSSVTNEGRPASVEKKNSAQMDNQLVLQTSGEISAVERQVLPSPSLQRVFRSSVVIHPCFIFTHAAAGLRVETWRSVPVKFLTEEEIRKKTGRQINRSTAVRTLCRTNWGCDRLYLATVTEASITKVPSRKDFHE